MRRSEQLDAQPVGLFMLDTDGLLELQLTWGTRTPGGWTVWAGLWALTFDAEHCIEMCQN